MASPSNQYAAVLGRVYQDMSKSVLAAIAVSLTLQDNEENWAKVPADIVREWHVLHQNGIITRPVPRAIREHYGID